MSVQQMRLLEGWQAPAGAGDPVACLATTFTFDPDFFEQECLGRFLKLPASGSATGRTADDINYVARCEAALAETHVAVVVDRAHVSSGRSKRWDVLAASAPPGGVQHAKLSVLLWRNATRLIVASANLTPRGYRSNIEVAWVIDLPSPHPLGNIAAEAARFLKALLRRHVAGWPVPPSPLSRAGETVDLLARRAAKHSKTSNRRNRPEVALVHTLRKGSLLDQAFDACWSKAAARPSAVTIASPYWISNAGEGDPVGLAAVRETLSSRGPTWCDVAVAAMDVGDAVRVDAPAVVRDSSGRGQLTFLRWPRQSNEEDRHLHAKILRWDRPGDWVMAMAGSANCTAAGMGLKAAPARNIELSIVVGDHPDRPVGKALARWLDFPPLEGRLTFDPTPDPEPDDDQSDDPRLPEAFGEALWDPGLDSVFVLLTDKAPPDWWEIGTGAPGVAPWFDGRTATADGRLVHPLLGTAAPPELTVTWRDAAGAQSAQLPVNVTDRTAIPPPPELRDLTFEELVELLGSEGRFDSTLQRIIERRTPTPDEARASVIVDPHAKVDTSGFVLPRIRRAANAFESLREQLERPVVNSDALRSRLWGPYGPMALAERLAISPDRDQPGTEQVFLLAELARMLWQVQWTVERPLDKATCIAATDELVDQILQLIPRPQKTRGSYARKVIQAGRPG